MANKMLIDATHPEETRVVVTRGNRIEEFDFESASRKQLRGNIYLAKVTRVEPSLQAAFIEYGGNRHGFLAFSEIHPDYYQIPVADRQALLEDDARADREAEEDDRRQRNKRNRGGSKPKAAEGDETISADAPEANSSESAEADHDDADTGDDHHDEADIVDHVGGGDILEDINERPRVARRQYKIQEVIKRRQILLVQVVKEERGNKGAALTTYLSLAGRYSVLMPNTGRGGGISRKITSSEDRKRLKEIAQDLEVPDGMGVILRTAGASRTKLEIKRDFEYLMRLWESVRELTMSSSAAALVYEEGSLIKRSIRDLYNKEIDEVLVAGDDAYREAKDFMRMLMPSHAKVVKSYKDSQPVFARFGVESQLDAMFSNQVTLRSGGYIVINPTEALVSIDVNSGRSTREHNIEDTALKTNLEAAEEVARQLRLRDLAGLVVIDFIDMEEKRNNRAVEKKMKDCLKNDRARIQVGRISPFGLLEMSRQRMRTGVLESSSVPCPHCGGTGSLRATPSVALLILRSLEEMLLKSAANDMTVRTRTEVALYMLNNKRGHLIALEGRFGVSVSIFADDSHSGKNYYTLERGDLATPRPESIAAVEAAAAVRASIIVEEDNDDDLIEDEDIEENEVEEEGDTESESQEPRAERVNADSDRDENTDEDGTRKRRRRRRRRGRGGERENGVSADPSREGSENSSDDAAGDDEDKAQEGNEPTSGASATGGSPERNSDARRRRGRRGGRRNRFEANGEANTSMAADAAPISNELGMAKQFEGLPIQDLIGGPLEAPASVAADGDVQASGMDGVLAKPKRASRSRKVVTESASDDAAVAVTKPKAAPRSRAKAAKAPAPPANADSTSIVAPVAAPAVVAKADDAPVRVSLAEPVAIALTPADPDRPKRGGWWAKAKSALGGD
jgi:ribonuclease E